MPAYRSQDEADIRLLVVERLREMVPGCRIIHEINAESFGNRIDVLAVGEDWMVAVEIKSKKDKLDRLPAQIEAMRKVTPSVYSAIHEKFLKQGARYQQAPDEARYSIAWAYPKADRGKYYRCLGEWHEGHDWPNRPNCLPSAALGMLWARELQEECAAIGAKGVSRMNMAKATDYLRWNLTGEQLTRMICRVLRARVCVEADAPITPPPIA